jgi:ubiquinone/menaquinone biosynthesis C-methylase UbiE
MRLQRLYIQIVNMLFNGLYAPFAWAYDWVADMVSLGRWQKWILAIQPLLEHDPILELGFGPGHLQAALLESHRNVTGVDLSRQMCKIAGKRITREGHAPRLVRAMGQKLPFPDEAFACLIATFPASYLFQAETAREAARVLVPGGRMVVLAFVQIQGTTLSEKILRKIFRQTGQEPTDDWITGRLLAAFQQAGFETKIQRVQCGTDVLLALEMNKSEVRQCAL